MTAGPRPLPPSTTARPGRSGLPTSTSAAVRAFDTYLEHAVRARASDLHLEPHGCGLRVRIRVDGRLRTLDPPPPSLADALLTRARLVARVDLSERRLPQDGRFAIDCHGERVDVRAAFVPAHGGEKITLRLLARAGALADNAARRGLADLGLPREDRRILDNELDRRDGMLVVVGPTGSGKTTTLYAALEHLAHPDLSVLTVEDPVERDLSGITQIGVDEGCGRSFSAVLRAILRHDPDVMMIGEMRDAASAGIACRAALTGHRVLTTMHTADTSEVPARLADLGVADYLVRATLRLVIAQRLIRRLCPCCRVERDATPEERGMFARAALPTPERLREPVGCADCSGTGYRGRCAIFELLDLRREARCAPRRTLLSAGLAAASAGCTSLDEIIAACPEPRR